MVLFSTKMRSGLKESPVIRDGDRKEERSAYSEVFLIDDRNLVRYERTTPGIPPVIKVGLTTRYNVLESFSLEAEGAGPFLRIFMRGGGQNSKGTHMV